MTVTSGFFNATNGDRTYNADQIGALFNGIFIDGIFSNIPTAFVVREATGMNVIVGKGRAWFKNTWTDNDADLIVAVSSAEVTLKRIDTVVIEVDKNDAVRANTIKVIKGTPATNPVAPTLVNTTLKRQYPLADLLIEAQSTTIPTAKITNRVGTAECPFITPLGDYIDSATLLAQWEAEFDAWFASVQNQLSGNDVINLQNQINTLDGRVDGHDTSIANLNYKQYDWTAISGSWSYASATSVNVPSDATTQFHIGDRIRFKQGGGYKYFLVIGVASTALSLYAGNDYSVANAAITDMYMSRVPEPYGFPDSFSFTPTWYNITPGNGIVNARVSLVGRRCKIWIHLQWAAASPTTSIGSPAPGVYAPIPVVNGYNKNYHVVGGVGLIDSGTALYMGAAMWNSGYIDIRAINAAGTYAVWSNISSTVPFAWGINDQLTVTAEYMV